MSTTNQVAILAQNLAAPALLLATFFGADSWISKDASKQLSDALSDAAQAPGDSKHVAAFREFLADNFGGSPSHRLQSVFLITVISLLFFLSMYTARMTGLFDQLMSKGFLAQFIGNGLVIVFLINWFTYRHYLHLVSVLSERSVAQNAVWIALDLMTKVVLFCVLTAVIYVMFAMLFGSFHGDVGSALHAVPVTILGALKFENLTGVYVYSLALSATPIYVMVLLKLMANHPALARLVQRVVFVLARDKPIRAAAAFFAGTLAAFSLAMTLVVSPLRVL